MATFTPSYRDPAFDFRHEHPFSHTVLTHLHDPHHLNTPDALCSSNLFTVEPFSAPPHSQQVINYRLLSFLISPYVCLDNLTITPINVRLTLSLFPPAGNFHKQLIPRSPHLSGRGACGGRMLEGAEVLGGDDAAAVCTRGDMLQTRSQQVRPTSMRQTHVQVFTTRSGVHGSYVHYRTLTRSNMLGIHLWQV